MSLLASRLNLRNTDPRNPDGIFLVVEVHPAMEPRLIRPTLANWKRRCARLGRPASLLVEPFGIYFWSGPMVVAWQDGAPALTLSFGDPWDDGEPPGDLMVGGTHYLWALANLGPVQREYLAPMVEMWCKLIAGQAHLYLPPCPGTIGLARKWLTTLFRDPAIAVEPVPGIGALELLEQQAAGAA